MNNFYLKTTFTLFWVACALYAAGTTQAYPPFLKQAAQFGAQDCTFCHQKPEGGEGWNQRGNWLLAEKTKRKADKIEVAWLTEFGDKAKTESVSVKPADQWAELENYHEIMSQTFHPAEEGKLEPIRKLAGELANRSQKWLASTPPKVYDTPNIKAILVKLNAETKALADAIAKGAKDEQIKTDLTALHDRFHEIMGACRDERKKQQ